MSWRIAHAVLVVCLCQGTACSPDSSREVDAGSSTDVFQEDETASDPDVVDSTPDPDTTPDVEPDADVGPEDAIDTTTPADGDAVDATNDSELGADIEPDDVVDAGATDALLDAADAEVDAGSPCDPEGVWPTSWLVCDCRGTERERIVEVFSDAGRFEGECLQRATCESVSVVDKWVLEEFCHSDPQEPDIGNDAGQADVPADDSQDAGAADAGSE